MKAPLALALTLLLGISVAACKDKPTDPDLDDEFRFTSVLLPSNEVPPVTNAEATASGTVTATLKTTKDTGGNITAATVDFVVAVAGFPAGSNITAAHIHPGVAGQNGSPLVNLALTSGELALNAAGAGTITKNNITMDTTQAQVMINTPANFYFNVHSTLNGGGVIRGQLVKQ